MPTAVPLSQMVDLALGTPELGAVNFNVLHTLLHAMITKLNIQDAKAEINDHDREFLQGTAKRVGSALHSDRDSTRGDDSLLDDTMSEVSFVPRKPASVPYHMLENRVAELAKQLEDLNALPTTQELIDRAQQKSEKSVLPVSEMWQGMQLKKRVDANEDGVSKVRTFH
ncbi:hypothetical protein BaRGS_00001991 [Batillaria attramentaria]|uniref:Uncharacterized protein n=1 Tax=Batillaria attramentaria TaxID=370345 RepID=A0ABD0M402_9CAEN